jgi:hypothetical protein
VSPRSVLGGRHRLAVALAASSIVTVYDMPAASDQSPLYAWRPLNQSEPE